MKIHEKGSSSIVPWTSGYKNIPPNRVPQIIDALGLNTEEAARLTATIEVSRPRISAEITKKSAIWYTNKVAKRAPKPSAPEGWKNARMLEKEFKGGGAKHTASLEMLSGVLLEEFTALGMSEAEARDEIKANWIVPHLNHIRPTLHASPEAISILETDGLLERFPTERSKLPVKKSLLDHIARTESNRGR